MLRALVGPLTIGIAVWCAAGTITIAHPDAASPRLALPAPWWVLPVVFAAALFVPRWRKHPWLTAPAALATVPWWPVPLPAIALLWTGPAAWIPIAAALICAVGSQSLAVVGRVVGAGDHRRSMMVAAAATLLFGGLAAWRVAPHVPAGDEPHYLVITQSLLKDHDLRIENNHRQRDYASFFVGELAPHYVTRGRDGEIYSIHAPGLPALVLPAFALFGYVGAQVWLLLLAAVTGSLIWRIGWRATGSAPAAWFAWAAIIGSATFLLHSFAVFPDGPGAKVTAAAILLLIRVRQTPAAVGNRTLLGVAALLAGLPWLHTRFVVLSAGLGALVVLWLLADSSRPPASRRLRAAIFLILPLVSAIAWFGFFEWIYGTPNPAAPYGGAAGTRAAYIPGGLAGLLFDEQFGLLIYAPVLMFAVVGVARLADPAIRRIASVTMATAWVYLAVVATYWLWWAGSPANPARFALAALPACAMPLAGLWEAADAVRRRMLLVLLTISLAISGVVVMVSRGDLAWNMRNGEAFWLDWLGPVVNLPRGWPSFFWRLDPAVLASEGAFFLHIALWMGVFVATWLLLQTLGRRRSWTTDMWRLALAGWALVAVMVAVQAGWWMNDVSGLDATRSQAAVLSSGQPVYQVSAGRVRRLATLDGAMLIRSEEPGRTDGPPPWLALESAPAGTYVLHISSSRPRAGQLEVSVSGGARPIAMLQVKPLSRQAAVLELPTGVRGLTLTPDRDLAAINGGADLEPIHLAGSREFARAATSYGSTNVFFMDDNAFVENDGFWVAGGTKARVALDHQQPEPGVPFTMTLQNGRSRNTVVLDMGASQRQETLEPSEGRTFELPDAGAIGAISLTISSPSGFRPSDDGTSRDSRYLGVRVRVR